MCGTVKSATKKPIAPVKQTKQAKKGAPPTKKPALQDNGKQFLQSVNFNEQSLECSISNFAHSAVCEHYYYMKVCIIR
jgi:hypothetical protein